METKKCNKCEVEYERNTKYFHKHSTNKDNLQTICKKCVKGYYRKNKDIIIQKSINRYNTLEGKESIKKCVYSKKGVYVLFENNTCLYVGESLSLNRRKWNHTYWIKNPNKNKSQRWLYEALQQHSNIEFHILEETNNHKEREQYYINKLKPIYNA